MPLQEKRRETLMPHPSLTLLHAVLQADSPSRMNRQGAARTYHTYLSWGYFQRRMAQQRESASMALSSSAADSGAMPACSYHGQDAACHHGTRPASSGLQSCPIQVVPLDASFRMFLQVGSQVRACRIAAQKGVTAIVQQGHRSRAPFLAPATQIAPQAERRRSPPMPVTLQQHGFVHPQFSALLRMHLSVGPGLAPVFC